MTYELKRKQIVNISRILILVAFVFIMLIPTAFAEVEGNLCQTMLDDVQGGLIEEIRSIFSKEDKMYNAMTTSDKESQLKIVQTVFDSLKVIGGLATFIIALIHLFEKLEKGQDGKESVFKCIIEIAFVLLVLINLEKLMGGVVGLGVALINDIGIASEESIVASQITLKDICGTDDPQNLKFFKTFLILAIPWIASVIIKIFVKFTAYSFLIEIGIRRAFAPLACCDIYAEGLRSPGVRYIKRFFAVFVKIMVCLVVCSISTELCTTADDLNTVSGVMTYLFSVIAVNFTAIGVMGKAGEYANDIVGA